MSSTCQQCEHQCHQAAHAGLRSAMFTVATVFWLIAIGLMWADLDGAHVPGIVSGLVALAGSVLAVGAIQIWMVDSIKASIPEPAAILASKPYGSGERPAVGTVVQSAVSSYGPIHDDTAQIPRQAETELKPGEAARLYESERERVLNLGKLAAGVMLPTIITRTTRP